MTNDLVGKIVRGYHIGDIIGSGGFGAVYKAHQPIIERDVAIKIIHAKYANQLEFTRRFELEARLIARIESQNIVPVYDFWRDPTGAFLVMRWLRGENLRTYLNQNDPLPLNFIVKVFFQLVSALDIAHQHHVVHRDIKPENVLFDEQQNVYLTDFGIAVDILHMPSYASTRTLSLGSPVYMAPEQLAREATSPHADVYSLGVMLYEMLTGKIPFSGNLTEVIRQKRDAILLPSLRESRDDLPPELDAVLWQATAHSPFARYRSMIDFFNAFIKLMPVQIDFSVLRSSIRDAGDSPIGTSSSRLMRGGDNTVQLGRDTQILNDTPSAPDNIKRLTTRQIEANIRNPFKGLRPFDEVDARDFFGRKEAIKRLCDFFTDEDNHFLAVVGPSGSGKSSLVRAGLLSVVRQQVLPNSNQWIVATMTPADDPFQGLAETLTEIAIQSSAPNADELRQSHRQLHHHLHKILPDDIDLFLLIDQFEEVFTIGSDEAHSHAFLMLLHYAITHEHSRLRLVITLRADYYDRPLQHPQFGELIREHTEVVLPLSDLALEEIIVEPSLQVGLALEPALKMAILRDVSGQQGALPLLQYTLSELYENRKGNNVLLHESYQALGGISGALSRRAESIYADLADLEQTIAQQLFLRCVTVGGNGTPTRKRVLMTDLLLHLPAEQRPLLTQIIEKFARWRLLTLDRDPVSRSPTIDIAHEALISAWSRLSNWIEDNRSNLRRYYQLQMLTQAWLEADKNASFLAVGARLSEFEAVLATPFISLSDDEKTFIQASFALKRRGVQRLRLAIATLIIFSIVAAMLAIFAFTQQQAALNAQSEALIERDRANTTAQIARSRELAANTLASLNRPDVALLLGYYAVQIADTFEARNSLLTALQSNPTISAYAHGHIGAVRALAFSADGTWVASAGEDRQIYIWDTTTWRPKHIIITDHNQTINTIAILGDSIFSASADGTLTRWDVSGDKSTFFVGHENAVWSIAVHPNGELLASGGEGGMLILWDINTGEIRQQISDAHADTIYSLAFSPDGSILATGGADNRVRFWDSLTGELLADGAGEHTNWVSAIAFSPSGKQVASAGADSRLILWDVATFAPIQSVTLTDDVWIRGLTYSATGEMMALAGLDGTLRLWDAVNGRMLDSVYRGHQSGIWAVATSPFGNQFITGGLDGAVIVWDFTPPYRPATHAFITGREALSMAIHPNGESMAVGLSNGFIQLWDINSKTPITRLNEHEVGVSALAYSPSGAFLASIDLNKRLIIWDMTDTTIVYQAIINEATLTPMIVFADETHIYLAGEGGLLRVDIPDGVITSISLDGVGMTSLAMSKDGQWLALGMIDGDIVMLNLRDDTRVPMYLEAHTGAVTALSFAENRSILVSASRDNTLIVWDYVNQRPLYEPLRAHTDWVLDVVIAPDERMMASAGRDQTVILWDLSTTRPLGSPFTGHRGWIQHLVFAPSGDRLYSAGLDGVVFEWMTSLADWQTLACQIGNREFRDDEWSRYFDAPPATCDMP